MLHEEETPKRRTQLKRMYDRTYWLWIIFITFDLIVQCLRTADASPKWLNFISKLLSCHFVSKRPLTSFSDGTETVGTLVLVLEIILRFIADWRNFHKSRRNWVDLCLAVITGVMQIPQIHNSGQPYAWLTFFQIIRIYRVVLAVPFTRDLLVSTPSIPSILFIRLTLV